MEKRLQYTALPAPQYELFMTELVQVYRTLFLQLVGSANEAAHGLIQPATLEISVASCVRNLKRSVDLLCSKYGVIYELSPLLAEFEAPSLS